MHRVRITRQLAPVASLALLTTLSAPSKAQAPISLQAPLSLTEALRLAEASQPLPKAASARVEATEARVRLAGKQSNPTIALARPYGSALTGGFGEDIIVSQAFEPGGVLGPRKRAAQHQQQVAQAERSAAGLDLRRTVTVAYIDCLRAEGEVSQAKAALEATQRFADAARVQFTAGDAPRSNVVRSQIESARFSQTLLQATTDRDNRYAMLRSLIGLPPTTPLVLADTLQSRSTLISLDVAKTLALSQLPEILAARAQLLASAADVASAKGQRLPSVLVEGRRANLNPGQVGYASIRVGVSLPLFDNGRIQADVRAGESSQRGQEFQLKEVERVAVLEVEMALRECEQAQSIVASFEGEGRLMKVKELLEMAQVGYEKGGNGYLEVIDAQRVFASEQVEYIRALASLKTATARLERVIGGPLL